MSSLTKETNNEGADIRKDSVRQARDTLCDALSTEKCLHEWVAVGEPHDRARVCLKCGENSTLPSNRVTQELEALGLGKIGSKITLRRIATDALMEIERLQRERAEYRRLALLAKDIMRGGDETAAPLADRLEAIVRPWIGVQADLIPPSVVALVPIVNDLRGAVKATGPREWGTEPQGCPTPGACYCPQEKTSDAANVPTCPRCDVEHWPHCPEEANTGESRSPTPAGACDEVPADPEVAERQRFRAALKDAVELTPTTIDVSECLHLRLRRDADAYRCEDCGLVHCDLTASPRPGKLCTHTDEFFCHPECFSGNGKG